MSKYIFKGRLCGYICEDCREPLSHIKVRLYSLREDQNRTALAVADPKDTLAVLTDEQVDAKANFLLAEVETDAEGQFVFELGDRYEGEAFEVDFYCGNVPRFKPPKPGPPRQLTVTTIQPQWRERENALVAVWDYCIPYRAWCYFRGLFGAWTICGRLTSCHDGTPIRGAVVNAFDADWLQDDALGSGTTDSAGHFRIDYSTAQFKKTPFSPWFNVEFTSGPDVYFTATLGSTTILKETQADGRKPGRQNVGRCFCVKLCSDIVVGTQEQNPHWNKVWDLSISPDAGQPGSNFSTEGYAGGANHSYVFNDSNYLNKNGVQLRGNCPLTNIAAPANRLQYRFVIGEFTWAGAPDDPNTIPSVAPAALVPVTQIQKTTVGTIYYFDGLVNASADVDIHSGDLDADGWFPFVLGRNVNVKMNDGTMVMMPITAANFTRFDELMVMNSTAITAAHAPKPPGSLSRSDAGRALTDNEKEPVRRYSLQFEVREEGTGMTIYTERLSSIILDNSPVRVALDIVELKANVCQPLAGATLLHPLYTVDHPHLGSFSMTISSNNGLIHGSPPMPGASFLSSGSSLFFRGGESGLAGFEQDISGDPVCAYSVSLAWSTRHYPVSAGSNTQMLYCKE